MARKAMLNTEPREFERVHQNKSLESVIIVDIDGTIAKMNGRSPYDITRVSEDLPIWDIINLVKLL
jgi:hypothetical protein